MNVQNYYGHERPSFEKQLLVFTSTRDRDNNYSSLKTLNNII